MAHPNFEEKTFAGGSKTAKYVNVFSLETFPPYKYFAGTTYMQIVCPTLHAWPASIHVRTLPPPPTQTHPGQPALS